MEHTILPSSGSEQADPIAKKLLTSAQYVLVIVFGLLPIFFIPSIPAPFGYSKVLFVVVGLFIGLILFSFSVLRSGTLKGGFSVPLLAIWAVAGFAVLSAVLSGDIKDSLIGNALGTQTAVFIALLALTTTVWSMFGSNKVSVMRLFMLLGVSTLVLSVFHIIRIAFGPDTLTFGVFQNATNSPLGGWNDLGIFFGLIVILALIALQQLRLSRIAHWLCVAFVIFSLGMLMVINFIAVWVVLGLISLITLIYSLTRGRHSGTQLEIGQTAPVGQQNFTALILSIVILLVAVLFTVAGSFLGGAVSNAVGISYVEVRPSFSATTDIVKNVYGESAIFGVGPNHFSDAWREFKNPGINATIFWNTNFEAGVGYMPTMFATMGMVGGALWIAFFIIFLVAGIRTLNVTEKSDAIWYFIGTASFVGGLYLWGMSFVYVPGPVLLLLAALCTGLVIASYNATGTGKRFSYSFQSSNKANIILISVITLIIIGSITAMYFTGNHYASVYTYNKTEFSISQGATLDETVTGAVRAYNLHEDDRYARRVAELKLAQISGLLQVQNPTEEQRERFLNAIADGREAGNRAIELDPTDPNNWSVLGSVFYALVPGDVEGAYEEARRALERARELDPQNPARVLALARLELAHNNGQGAYDLARVAVEMKPNYRDAMFFLSQLQILRGELNSAAQLARGMTVLDPQNPVMFFQLGIIERELGNIDTSTAALERAVQLDRNYANARYFLAFNYSDLSRREDAREQLAVVAELNPNNELVTELINQLDRGEWLRAPGAPAEGESGGVTGTTTAELPIEEDEDAEEIDASGVITEEDVDSPLVSPVNQVSSSEEEADSVTDTATEANES